MMLRIQMPGPEDLPLGPHRDLVAELHRLWEAAGRPGIKTMATRIRQSNYLDTVSHEKISAILHGEGVPRWSKIKGMVLWLATQAIPRRDPDAEAERFLSLWQAADRSRHTDRVGDEYDSPPARPGPQYPGSPDQVRVRVQSVTVPADVPTNGLVWRALGPVEAMVGGRTVDLGPPRQRALFALLLSRVDQPVALDVVIEDLWYGDPPPAAWASVRTYLSNLRRALEPNRPPRAHPTVLRTRAPGYLLDSRGVIFDVHTFTRHATNGRAALGRNDPVRAVGEFEEALGLWRGRAYADLSDAAWVAPEAARLEEQRLSVLDARFEAQLQLGEHHTAVADLEMHVRSHPLREHGCELLALALYRAGRQAEALGTLRTTRRRLADELGIDPGTALQRLEQDILTHAPELDWRPPRSGH